MHHIYFLPVLPDFFFAVSLFPRVLVLSTKERYGISQEQSLSSKSVVSPRAPQEVRDLTGHDFRSETRALTLASLSEHRCVSM